MISVSPSNAGNPSATAIPALGAAAANSVAGDFRQTLQARVGAPQAEGPAGNAAPQNPSSGKSAVPQDATVGQKNSSAKRSADAKPSTKAEPLAAGCWKRWPSRRRWRRIRWRRPPHSAWRTGQARPATWRPQPRRSPTETIPAGLRSASALPEGLAGLPAAASAGGVTMKAAEPSLENS